MNLIRVFKCYKTIKGIQVENSSFGKWLHPAFTGASFAYFLTMIDKSELIASYSSLYFATLSFAVALIVNGIFSFAYYIADEDDNVDQMVNRYWITRRFNSLSQWSFIFAVVALLYFFVSPLIGN